MKQCRDCGESFDESNFYKGSAKCKPCYRERVKKYYEKNRDHYREYEKNRAMLPHRIAAREAYLKTEAGKQKSAEAKRRWARRNITKRAAHIILGNAVRDGKAKKPNCCEQCGSKERIHGHHDDYAKPLDVRWLCATCHRELHRKGK